MKKIKKALWLIGLISASMFSANATTGADNVDFGVLNVDNSEFEFKCDWIYNGSEKLISSTNRDFILHNGNIYINNYRTSPAYDLAVIDATNGQCKSSYTLTWPGTVAKRHAVFVGRDGVGNAFCSTEGNPTTAFELCLLKFDSSGAPSVDKLFTLPLQSDWYVRSVDISGDMAAGNFTVFSAIWKSDEMNTSAKSTETGIAAWKVSNGVVGTAQFISKNVTITDIEPIDENRFIIVCRGAYYEKKKDVVYTTPTLCEWNPTSGQWRDIDTFNGTMFSKCTNSVEVFTLGGKQFMAYWNATGLLGAQGDIEGSHFGIAYTPGLPNSFSATTIVPNFGIGNATISYEQTCGWPWKANSAVHTEKISDAAERIVICDHGGNLRSYILSTTSVAPPVIEKYEPIFNPALGTELNKGDKVEISCEGALIIMYKLNGGDTAQYTDAIALDADASIEAWGVYADGEGPHATASYTVKQPIPKYEPVFNPASGTELSKGDKVTISCQGAVTILYKLNGGDIVNYSDAITLDADASIEAWGVYADSDGPHATASYTVKQPIPKYEPVFNPTSGTELNKGDKVTITCQGAVTILYKLNGGAVAQYNEAIALDADANIEAWGVYADGEGPHATASYTVKQPIPKYTPVFNPASGTELNMGDKVTISCQGAVTILYKLNGGDIVNYSDAITLDADASIEAWGVYADGEGPHATASYTVKQPIPKYEPVFNPASGTELNKGDKVTISCQGAVTILYKLNGGDTVNYSDAITLDADASIEAWGVYVDGEGPHATASYTVKQPIPKYEPVFNPTSGTELNKGDKVTITCQGAVTILYKLNGGAAAQYNEAIVLEADASIEAWGVYADGEGPHATASYTVKQPIPKYEPVFNPTSGTELNKGDKVTITCQGAVTILYKLNGGAAAQYNEAIALDADASIEAWGVYVDGEGPHATASYTVKQPIPKYEPVFNPASGTELNKGDKVTISCQGAVTILYKLNGGAVAQYNEAITLDADANIEAWGIYADGEGPHATASYTVKQPIPKYTPVFNPASGTELSKGDKVTISCQGAVTILYKLNGGDIVNYSDAITLDADASIEAWGVYADGEGPHTTASYTVKQPIPKYEPVFNPASGTELSKGDKVTICCQGAVTILYKLNGGAVAQYNEAIVLEADASIEAWGIYADGEGPHATASYTVKQPIPKYAPVFNPASGTELNKGDKVTISCQGAVTILYKLNGGAAAQYNEAIALDADASIEAWGVYADGEGPHATASYTVKQPIPKYEPVFNPASGKELDKGDRVAITCEGALIIMYKLNGGEALLYDKGIRIDGDCSIEAWGVYADGEGPHATAAYTIRKNIAKYEPVFNPVSGTTLKKGDKVTITCKEATIVLYRLNGGTVTPYLFDPIVIENDCEIEAWGVYPDTDGPHAVAKYFVDRDDAEHFLCTNSLNDIESGMAVKFAAIDDDILFGALPCGYDGVGSYEIGEYTPEILSTSQTGTYTVDVCNRGGYTIRDNASGDYLRVYGDDRMSLGSHDFATSFYFSYKPVGNIIYVNITNKDGDRQMYYDSETKQFILTSNKESNILLYRYAFNGKPAIPETLYLHINNGEGWNFSQPIPTIDSYGKQLTIDTFHVTDGKPVELFLSDMKGTPESEAADWMSVTPGRIFIPTQDITDVEDGTTMGMIAYPEAKYIGVKAPTAKVAGVGNYTFTVEFGGFSPLLHISKTTGTTGVDMVPAENSDVEYFNLQGIRIERPTRGFYIERRGNQVRKIYISNNTDF